MLAYFSRRKTRFGLNSVFCAYLLEGVDLLFFMRNFYYFFLKINFTCAQGIRNSFPDINKILNENDRTVSFLPWAHCYGQNFQEFNVV